MKTLLVSTNQCRQPVTVMPIGVCRIADALAGAGHVVRVLDLMFTSRPLRSVCKAVKEFRPDFTGISIRNIDNGNMSRPIWYLQNLPAIVECVRREGDCPVVVGGGAVSVMPEEILRWSGADWAVMGEGENVMLKIVGALERDGDPGKLPGVGVLDNGRFALDSCGRYPPMDKPVAPDYQRWVDVPRYTAHGASIPIQTKRGCPRDCLYCTYPLIEGRSHRVAPPGEVRSAIKRYVVRGYRDFEFVDNVFNDPPEHALDVCRALKGIDSSVRFRTTDLSARQLNRKFLKAMKAAGFGGFGVSVESASEKVDWERILVWRSSNLA